MAENVTEEMEDAAGKAKKALPGSSNGGLAKKILLPAAAGVGTVAASYAARKAPDLLRGQLSKLEEKGSDEAAGVGARAAQKLQEQGGLTGKLAEKVTGGGGGPKKTRRLPIQRWTDVAAPVETAYKAWLDFEKFPTFMHRVLSVEKRDAKRVSWREKIWFSTREWESEITDRRANDRIAWKTKRGPEHSGVVSFHKIGDRLTRVMVTVDFHPTGLLEKMASGLRFVKRAVESDLARFKAYVELEDAKGLEYAREETDEPGDADQELSRSRSNSARTSKKELAEAQRERATRRAQRRR